MPLRVGRGKLARFIVARRGTSMLHLQVQRKGADLKFQVVPNWDIIPVLPVQFALAGVTGVGWRLCLPGI